MGRVDFQLMRYLQPLHYRVLTAVEMGMKNHELVPLHIVAYIAGTHRGAVNCALSQLREYSAVIYEKGKRFDGYRLTQQGYDFLALNALHSREIVGFVFEKIGVGKESQIFLAADAKRDNLVLKLHKLGRTFRKLKEKRDYHNRRKFCSWLYLARLAAENEYKFLKVLYENDFPVPRPIDICRHTVVMDFISGVTLCNVRTVDKPEILYDKLMSLIVRLGECGLIHGDFNEFNIILTEEEEPVLIDFPQMLSIDHENADFYFDRDVGCIRKFFIRRFHYESELYPKLSDINRTGYLDVMMRASGVVKQKREKLEENENENDAEIGHKSRAEKESLINDSSDYDRTADWIKCTNEHFGEAGLSNECPLSDTEDEPSHTNLANVEKYEEDNSTDGSCVVSSDEDVDSKAKSVLTYRTNCPAEVIRKRVISEIRLREKKERKKLNAKGKAGAVRQMRKNNADLIKEHAGWSF